MLFHRSAFLDIVLLVALGAVHGAQAQTIAEWTGAGSDDLYSNPDNWSLGGDVPLNDGTTYSVVIPGGESVVFDVVGSSEIDGLELGTTGEFMLEPGAALTVLASAALGGRVSASGNGASLTAVGTGSTLLDGALLAVSSSASIHSSAPSYDYGVVSPSTATVFAADGPGSLLDLSSLQIYVDGKNFNAPRTRTLIASNQGVLDLSGLTSLTGGVSDDLVAIQVTTGGSILLDALTTVIGRVRFDVDNPTMTLPVLESATQTEFHLDANTIELPSLTTLDQASFQLAPGAVFGAPNLTTMTNSPLSLDPAVTFTSAPLSQIDGARITVAGGLSYAAVVDGAYDYGTVSPSTATVFSVDGPGSVLDLSSLRIYVDGKNFNAPRTRTLVASNQGVLDLSGLVSLTGGVSDDIVAIQVANGGSILLDALTTVIGRVRFDVDNPTMTLPVLESATQTEFHLDANTIELPSLTTLDQASFQLAPGAVFDAPNLTTMTNSPLSLDPTVTFTSAPLSQIDGARITVTGGLSYAAVVDGAYDYGTVSPSTATVFAADGPGSLLDLSSLQIYVDGKNFNAPRTRTLVASDQGVLDLSGLVSLTGGVSDDIVAIQVANGGSILLDALTTVIGRVRFDVDNPTMTLPVLESATQTEFHLDANTIELPSLTTLDQASFQLAPGAVFDAPNLTTMTNSPLSLDPTVTFTSAPLSQIDGARITVTGGLSYAAVVDGAYDYGTVSPSTATVFSVDGPGSVLDLSSLQTYVDGKNFNAPRTRTLVASNQGVLDLSGLTSLTGGVSDDLVAIQVTTGGTILLSELGGVARPGGLASRVSMLVDGAGSRLEVANLDLGTDQSLTVQGGGTLRVGEGLVYTSTVESQVDLGGGRLVYDRGDYPGRAVLEAGSQDLGTGGPTSGNFGIGQVVAGGPGETVTLHVVDWEDNGNRTGGAESLYLFGLEGDDGLRVRNGSAVLIPVDVSVYAAIDGVMTLLNDLFPEGEDLVAFDEGFLQIGEASAGIDAGESAEAVSLELRVGPTPSRSAIGMEFGLSHVGPVSLRLHDVSGRLVRSLIETAQMGPGRHHVVWDGRDENGHRARSGVYFVRLRTDGRREAAKVTLLP